MLDAERCFIRTNFLHIPLRQGIGCSGLRCEGRFWERKLGPAKATLPVGVGRFRRAPHIALSGAFLALRASDCNRWPRRWVWGRRRDWAGSRTVEFPANRVRGATAFGYVV